MNKILFPLHPILVIDDEIDILDSYKKILRNSGINNIVLCEDSREACKLAKEYSPSLILLDLMMPNISGNELLKNFNHDFPEIPVIIITGSNKIETAIECMKNGAADFLLKPVEKER
jgi:DNA-binding NtrC family response regulator